MTTSLPMSLPQIDWSEAYLVVSMFVGLLVSVLLLADTYRDRAAAAHLPKTDPRLPLAMGLFIMSIGYLLLKAVIFYLALALIIDLPGRAAVARIGLAASINVMDVCVGIFWYLRRRSL